MTTSSNINLRNLFHFKIHRVYEYLDFYYHYIHCKLFHEQEEPKWESWKGAIVCTCGIGIDLGYSYAQHCETCYELARELNEKRLQPWDLLKVIIQT